MGIRGGELPDSERADFAIRLSRALIELIEDKDRAVEEYLRATDASMRTLGGDDHSTAIEQMMVDSLSVTNASRQLLATIEEEG
jgi:hypothetical protein